MLKIHAEKQRKYIESLSPDTKAPIQENDAGAYRKWRESLSPDTKARFQEDDAAANQRQRKIIMTEEKKENWGTNKKICRHSS